MADGFFAGGAADDGDDIVQVMPAGLSIQEDRSCSYQFSAGSFPGGGLERGIRCGSGAGF